MSADESFVTGDTLILTDHGYMAIKDICESKINMWDGFNYRTADIYKSKSECEFYLITTSDGCELKCTINHTFIVQNNDGVNNFKKKRLEELDINDIIKSCRYPIIEGDISKDSIAPYTIGLLMVGNDLYDIPMNSSLSNKLAWLTGFIDSYGELVNINGTAHIRIHYIFKDFLYNVKLLCNTLMLNPRLRTMNLMITKLVEELNGVITYYLVFNQYDTRLMIEGLKLPFKRLQINKCIMTSNYDDINIKIQSINKLPMKEYGYNFFEPISNTGILNGLLTSK